MISQQQNNIRESEEETSPPHEQKQPPAPTSSWRGWSLWLRVLGVIVALVGGLATVFIMNTLINVPLEEVLLPPILVGFVSASLLRSWWALLIIPVAFSVGTFLGFALGFVEDADFIVILGILPVELGVGIGTPIGKWIEKRVRH